MFGFSVFTSVPIRLLGYGFAVGEAMRHNYSGESIDLAYSIGTGFVVSHVIFSMITSSSLVGIAVEGTKTLCYEGLASCLIPTICNHHICNAVYNQMSSYDMLSDKTKRWLPFVAGTCMVPVYMMLVDPLVGMLVFATSAPVSLVVS